MARTIESIYNAIIEEKEAKTTLSGLLPANETATNLLNDLTSNSKVAVWRLWAYITAVIMHTHELLWDLFKADVEIIAASAPAGTAAWLQKKVKEYQHGDALVYENLLYKYAEIDETKKVVSVAAIEERTNGVIVVKVAKDDGSGGLIALTSDEKLGLTSYIYKIKFAGSRIAVFTSSADLLDIQYDLYYDPIVPMADLINNINSSINDHLRNLDFNGKLNVNKFTDMLQATEGVVDPVFKSAKATASVSGDEFPFDVEQHPTSGYFELQDTIQNMFNFIAKV